MRGALGREARAHADTPLVYPMARGARNRVGRLQLFVPIRKDGKRVWKKHDQCDLAVLPLPEPVVVDAVRFECLADEKRLAQIRTGDSVRLAVFPGHSEVDGVGFTVRDASRCPVGGPSLWQRWRNETCRSKPSVRVFDIPIGNRP